MARYLTQKQIDEFRECFSLYDKKKTNKIGVRDVITVMRSLGNLTQTISYGDRITVHKRFMA